MRYLIVSILLLAAINQSLAPLSIQTKEVFPATTEFEKVCGSSSPDDSTWVSIQGKAVEVVGSNAIVVLTASGERKHVSLAGVKDPQTIAARALLLGLVLNREVTVIVNRSNATSEQVTGIVHAQTRDINRELLAAGAAPYQKPESHTMSDHLACVYRIVEQQAREHRRGMWAQERDGNYPADVTAPDSEFFRKKLGEPALVYRHKSGVSVQIAYDNKDQVCSIFITDPSQTRYPRPFHRLLAVADELVPASSRGALRDMTRNIGNCIQVESKDYERVFVILNQDACYEQRIRILFKRPSCPKLQKVQRPTTWQ